MEKSTLKFIKDKVSEMGLRDKMEFFHWLMLQLTRDLNENVKADT